MIEKNKMKINRRARQLVNSISMNKHLFALVVMITAFLGVISWWSVFRAVQSDMNSRLEVEASSIEAKLQNQVDSYVEGLVGLRGHFYLKPRRTAEEFNKIVEAANFLNLYPGLKSLGYANYDADSKKLEISLLEPRDEINQGVLGKHIADSVRADVIDRAFRLGRAQLSAPMELYQNKSQGEPSLGFVLILPFAKQEKGESTSMVFATFRVKDFLRVTLGDPSTSREIVSFSLVSLDQYGRDVTIYDRFESLVTDERPLQISKNLNVYGSRWKFTVTALPSFYRSSDRFLPTAVAVSAVFISLLIFVSFRLVQSQLHYEKKAKEKILISEKKVRHHTALLKKINGIAQGLGAELDLDKFIKKFFRDAVGATEASHAFLFFANRENDPENLRLHDCVEIKKEDFFKKVIRHEELADVFRKKKMLRRSDRGAQQIADRILIDLPKQSVYSDWVLSVISSHDHNYSGLLFLARQGGQSFSDHEIEMIDNLSSLASIGIENAKLFRRAHLASLAKNAFLANMSHEIRTPLGAILGFADMLQRKDVDEDRKQELMLSMRKNGEQLTRIIDDILDLTKVEAGKLFIERKRIELATMVHEIQSVMTLRSKQRGVNFSIDQRGLLPRFILTDEVRLKQILMNIIGNAIKFTEKGSVRLHMSYREMKSEDHEEHMLYFTVEDSGIGISDEARLDLFQPFSQGDASNTRRFSGTGLGLALSRRLAEQLGGDIRLLRSEKDVGSTFEISISCATKMPEEWVENLFQKPALVPTHVEVDNNLRLDGKKILLVEDSEDNQDIFTYFLEGAGAEVELAKNGLEAVQKALHEDHDYDAVLMDIQIPGIDGKEASRRLRRQGFSKPIIALTAHAMAEEKQSCLQAGCNGQITKPVDRTSLLSQLSSYLG